MKVYIVQDMEGVSGIVRKEGDLKEEGADRHREARLLMTLEINAAVEGALEGGATEVRVHEAHRFILSELHPEAELVMGYRNFLLDDSFSAMFIVGQHARARTMNAVMAHSWSSKSIREMSLNGILMGEIGLTAVYAGCYGVPVALVTGDRAATEEARELLGDIETAAVKEGFGLNAALCMPFQKARDLIRQKARAAMGRCGEIAPYVLQPPIEFRTEFHSPAVAERCELFPGVKRLDATTVSYTADDYMDIFTFRLFQALVNWF